MAEPNRNSRWVDWQFIPKGGLNLDDNPNAVREDELITALNVWYRGASLGTRPGASRETEASTFTAALTGPVQGGVEFRRGNDATRSLVIISNGVIYDSNSGATITKSVAGHPTGTVVVGSGAQRIWTFAVHNDVLYAAGGSGTDTPWYWTGSGDATLLPIYDASGSAAGDLLFPTYIFAKWNRLYACGFRTAAGAISTDITSNPMTPRFSALNQPTVWPTGNTFAGTGVGGLPAYGNEFLTGFGEYTDNDGDFLMLLTNRHIYAVQEDPNNALAPFYISRKGAISFGCVSQHAFVSLGLDSGDAIYMSEHGIHSLRQTQQFGATEDKMISWKIRSIFRTINRAQMRYAVGSYFREEGVVVFAVPTGSDTFNSLLLILDVKGQSEVTSENARWFMARLAPDTTSKRVTTLFPARSSAGKWYLYGGTVFGDVFRFDDTSNDDFGDAYESTFQTPWADFGAPQRQKTLGDLYCQLQPRGDYSARVSVHADYGARTSGPYTVELPGSGNNVYGGAVYGNATYGTSQATNQKRIYATGYGTNFSIQVTRSAAQQPYYVAKLAGRVAPHGVSRGI